MVKHVHQAKNTAPTQNKPPKAYHRQLLSTVENITKPPVLERKKNQHSKSRNEGYNKKTINRLQNSDSLSYLDTNRSLKQIRKSYSNHRRNQGKSTTDKEINALLSINFGPKNRSHSRKYSLIKQRKLRQNRKMSLVNAKDRKTRLANYSELGKTTQIFLISQFCYF